MSDLTDWNDWERAVTVLPNGSEVPFRRSTRLAPIEPPTPDGRMIPEEQTTSGLYRRIRESGIDLNDPANWVPCEDPLAFLFKEDQP